jgi:hypothetical protein
MHRASDVTDNCSLEARIGKAAHSESLHTYYFVPSQYNMAGNAATLDTV